ncbi:MAG: hypothetical protein WCH61_00645 [bacterium]
MNAPVIILWLGLAVMAGLTTGCTSIQVGDRALVQKATAPGLTTKAAVVQRLGGPDAVVTLDDGQQLLTYGNSVVRGGGLLVSYAMAPLLHLNRANRCGDTVLFTLAADGRVTKIRVLANADRANGSIWPFSP